MSVCILKPHGTLIRSIRRRADIEEFDSDNARRLTLEETKEKIASLEYIQKELAGQANFVQ